MSPRTSKASNNPIKIWWHQGTSGGLYRSQSDVSSDASRRSHKRPKHRKHRSETNSHLEVPVVDLDSHFTPPSPLSQAVSDTSLQDEDVVNMANDSYRDTSRFSKTANRRSRDGETETVNAPLRPDRHMSLFEAARELRKQHVTIKFCLKDAPLPASARDSATNRNGASEQPKLFPEHLLGLHEEGTYLDHAFKMVLNAGASVEFTAEPYGSSYTSVRTCPECQMQLGSEVEYEEHVSSRDCPFCNNRFECKGLLNALSHACAPPARNSTGVGRWPT